MNTPPWDCIIIGSGPAGLGAAFHILRNRNNSRILILEKESFSTGGLRNDCKMNFTYPVGFPEDLWSKGDAERYLEYVKDHLSPPVMEKKRLDVYIRRAERLGVRLLTIAQAHLGTDGGLALIKKLMSDLKNRGAEITLGETALRIDFEKKILKTDKRSLPFLNLVIAPGRKGFHFLQKVMKDLNVSYLDNIVDIGVRLEMTENHYPIVQDYYDPKFLFPGRVRTFCTNSKAAHVVKEKYTSSDGRTFYSVNGHAWSDKKKQNNLVNFALLKTVNLTEPLASGHQFASMLGLQASLLGGDRPIMQRVGDFRMGRRSKKEDFNNDLYDFKPTLTDCTPGDIALSLPAKILRGIWKSMKQLDTIIPGVLHPSTIIYYPEIKMYANKPRFKDSNFQVLDSIYMIGDGAGTSRGITAAWASGIRAANGVLKSIN